MHSCCCICELKNTSMLHAWTEKYVYVACMNWKKHTNVACVNLKIHQYYMMMWTKWYTSVVYMWTKRCIHAVCTWTERYIYAAHVYKKIQSHCSGELKDVFMLLRWTTNMLRLCRSTRSAQTAQANWKLHLWKLCGWAERYRCYRQKNSWPKWL